MSGLPSPSRQMAPGIGGESQARARNLDAAMVVPAHHPGGDTTSQVLVTSNLAGAAALEFTVFRPRDLAGWMGHRALDIGRAETA